MRSENFLLLSAAAKTFGCRPSAMAGLDDPVLALDFDLAATARLLARERTALARITESGHSSDLMTANRTLEEDW